MEKHDIYITVNLWGITSDDHQKLEAAIRAVCEEFTPNLNEPAVINWDWLD
jgi:hypothetical protein